MDFSDFINTYRQVEVGYIVFYLPGLVVLGYWALRNRFGLVALEDSPSRRNMMPVWAPFVPFVVWLVVVTLGAKSVRQFWPDLADWQYSLADNIVLCGGALIGSAVIIYLSNWYFMRQLKGLGVKVSNIGKDGVLAGLNLYSVWPLLTLTILLTSYLGSLIYGSDYEMERHAELEILTENPQLVLRVAIIVTTIFVVPVFEELLFRGMFQSMIRSYTGRPWVAVFAVSVIFATVHANPSHWPALFVLSVCLGYGYEKSGSILRPIFVHSFFNGVSVIASLYGGG